MRLIWTAAAIAAGLVVARPASAQVKIGILNDQSGVYADYGVKYSVEAARMAIEDFGGTVLARRSTSSPPTTRTSRTRHQHRAALV